METVKKARKLPAEIADKPREMIIQEEMKTEQAAAPRRS